MDALADRAVLVLRLALLARHPGPPGQHALAVRATWQIRVGAVLGLGGRTIDIDPLAMRPLDVVSGGEPAVGEMACRKVASAHVRAFQHRPHEAAVGAGVANLDRHHDLLAGGARHLHVVSRSEAAVGHLHHPRVWIGRGGTRLLLWFARLAARLFALPALRLDLAE